jgi:hypothetical protein
MVTGMLEVITRHNHPLYGNVDIMGHGTHKRMSYEVQPTSHQECAKRVTKGSKICDITKELLSQWHVAALVRLPLQSVM